MMQFPREHCPWDVCSRLEPQNHTKPERDSARKVLFGVTSRNLRNLCNEQTLNLSHLLHVHNDLDVLEQERGQNNHKQVPAPYFLFSLFSCQIHIWSLTADRAGCGCSYLLWKWRHKIRQGSWSCQCMLPAVMRVAASSTEEHPWVVTSYIPCCPRDAWDIMLHFTQHFPWKSLFCLSMISSCIPGTRNRDSIYPRSHNLKVMCFQDDFILCFIFTSIGHN